MSSLPLELLLQWTNDSYRALVPPKGEPLDPARLVLKHAHRGELDLAQGEMYQFQMFVKHLGDVQRDRPAAFRELQRRMYQCAQVDNYFGLRMETRIASSLARKQMAFELQERPDFSIDGGRVFIECGSVWPTDTTDGNRDYRARVASTFRKKGRSRYATSNTMLALEATSILAAMVTHRQFDDASEFDLFLEEELRNTGFGALVLFFTGYSPLDSRVQSTYNRYEAPHIAQELREFLDTWYPQQGLKTIAPFIPGQRGLGHSAEELRQPKKSKR